jgi:hypothetical protein
MSNEIAIQNQQYKDQAEGKLHDFYQQEGDAKRQSAQAQTDFKNQKRQAQMGAVGDMVGGLLGGDWSEADGGGYSYNPPNVADAPGLDFSEDGLTGLMNDALSTNDIDQYNKYFQIGKARYGW